jgi:hypothetical protein
MTDRSRSRAVAGVLAAATAAAIAVGAATLLLVEAFEAAMAPFRTVVPPAIRYGLLALALLGVVPAIVAAASRTRRPSTDFLRRRTP